MTSRPGRRHRPTVSALALAALVALVACDGQVPEPTGPAAAPQLDKTVSTLPLTIHVQKSDGTPAVDVTVGIVGNNGPEQQKETDPTGTVTFDVAYGKVGGSFASYCAWASPIRLSSMNPSGSYDYIIPPNASGGGLTGLTNQGAVVTTASGQVSLSQSAYVQNCRQSRPIVLKNTSGTTDFSLQLDPLGSGAITIENINGADASNLLYLIDEYQDGWRPLDPSVQDLHYGFLLGAVTGTAGKYQFPNPGHEYKLELLTSTPNGVPANLSLHSDASGSLGQTSYIVEPLTCNTDSVFDATGDASSPDIIDYVRFGYGADATTFTPVPTVFSVWWLQAQTTNTTASMKYTSRTDVTGYPTLQLFFNFDVTLSSDASGSTCAIGNASFSGTAADAGVTPAAYCAAVDASHARVTVIEQGLPDAASSHSFTITTPSNAGQAESVPDASRPNSTASQVGTSQCHSPNSKFDILN